VTGRNLIVLCRPGAEKSQEKGWHEPYESRGSRTELWGTGGEIPPVYPAVFAQLVAEGAKGPEDCAPMEEEARQKLREYLSAFQFASIDSFIF
jgi:hypothetical protein